jgi:hypothetical protein
VSAGLSVTWGSYFDGDPSDQTASSKGQVTATLETGGWMSFQGVASLEGTIVTFRARRDELRREALAALRRQIEDAREMLGEESTLALLAAVDAVKL